jgi:hypothetical protein
VATIYKILTAVGILFIVIYLVTSGKRDSAPVQPAEKSSEVMLPKFTADKDVGPPAWSYSSSIDPMRKSLIYYAEVKSINKLYFDFPYQGGFSATLKLRKSQRFGRNIMLTLEKGQFICHSYNDGCDVAMKFDDGKIENYRGLEPSDGSSDILFLSPYEKIINKLRNSRRLTIETEFYQEGLQDTVKSFTQILLRALFSMVSMVINYAAIPSSLDTLIAARIARASFVILTPYHLSSLICQ